MVDDLKPDILFISEANLFEYTPEYETNIVGYNLIKPKTSKNPNLLHSRIVALVRDEINFKVMTNIMEDDTAAIWLKITKSGHKKIIVGGVYREHRHIKIPKPNLTGTEASQNDRGDKK